MVVLAASIVSKSGKALVSRQFVDMSRSRVEGLLAAFPKLVGSGGKQHTFVETENVRYVYQPIEALYLLLITNKQSNIVEDLGALTLLAKLIPEYSTSLDEEGVCKAAFELIFAFDETISLGYKENVTVTQVKQYCEMESHEERLHKLVMQSKINETKDVMKRKASEIYKNKVDKSRDDKGGFMSLSGPKSFSDLSFSSSGTGFGSGYGLEVSSVDVDSFSSKSKAPLDLLTDDFYVMRKSSIESHLQKIQEGMAEEMLITSWQLHEGTACHGVNWDRFSLSDLRAAVSCVGGHCLASLCSHLAMDYRSWSSGMPDLLLWRFHGGEADGGEAKLVEVKGPRDRLSEQQRAWILTLMECGFNAEVCKVRPSPKS